MEWTFLDYLLVFAAGFMVVALTWR